MPRKVLPKARSRRAVHEAPAAFPAEHVSTAESRQSVTNMAGLGLPQEQIALLVGVSAPTLRKHYGLELELGEAQATAKVSQTLFRKAIEGDLGACIFWLKVRGGWSEKVRVDARHSGKVAHEHSGEVGLVLSSEQRAAVLAAVRARAQAGEDEPDAGAVRRAE
jgi:hypothetical protein